MGKGVSEECTASSAFYLQQLQHVSLPENHPLDPLFQANGAALKMLDASAKLPPAGMLTNLILHHPGSFSSCLEVQSPNLTGQ